MNVGLYQSAASLSALERWQDTVAQNITSSQVPGYRKRTINFSSQSVGERHPNARGRIGQDAGMAVLFPKTNSGINFLTGETHLTRRNLDVALQGEGFFEFQIEDGSRVYSRSGEFRLRADRTLVNAAGHEVLNDGGSPITLLRDGGEIVFNPDGTLLQGETPLGRLSIQKFADNSTLVPVAGGYFVPGPNAEPEPVEAPTVMQGYLEGSNITPLREMVDLVLISRAYEANQKIIHTIDQQMQKTLEALG